MSKLQNELYSGIAYIGSYGGAAETTVRVCRFNGAEGSLQVTEAIANAENASYLALHPQGGKLYAVSETESTDGAVGGAVIAYGIDPVTGGLLGQTSKALSHGAHPCYISLDATGKSVFVANYTGGNVALLPLNAEGELAGTASVADDEGELGPNAARQDAPHAHSIVPIPGTAYVCVADLGIDEILVYRYDGKNGTLTKHSSCAVHRGAGPRHLVFHAELPLAYVMNELDSTIATLQVNAEKGTLKEIRSVSALPEGFGAYNDAADIHLAPSGRFLYSSNRGHDSIAVFAVDQSSGELTLVQHIGSGGQSPRNFALSPDGSYLLAANQKSGNIAAFRVNEESGELTALGTVLDVPSPVCIRFGMSL
ncbi:lactonase family protein [Paenibacillus harenae]|uniref:6-phosphogluconolactonase n=1 Tax=Paenibacillus harenae TaxID=306543 RepID=A0ABT9TXE7_PAEHA|nr:lactonase family protein [Paenibacillus harenae]MDQ0060435.1 6-phosphogluconolactonase [Paenibacillus harenae]MDQ0112050.1 6-phosphogluconolactonase [Paenibacillus harenae]